MKTLSLIILLAVVTTFSLACGESGANNKDNIAVSDNTKKAAPDFSLEDINGKVVKLSDFKNKIVIIDFWATWCPPCRKGIPDLIELQNDYKKDLVIIGISLDRETKKDVPGFVKNYGINYPIVYGNQEVSQKYGGIQAIPTSFIIDKKGYIVETYVGLVPKSNYETIIKQIKDSK